MKFKIKGDAARRFGVKNAKSVIEKKSDKTARFRDFELAALCKPSYIANRWGQGDRGVAPVDVEHIGAVVGSTENARGALYLQDVIFYCDMLLHAADVAGNEDQAQVVRAIRERLGRVAPDPPIYLFEQLETLQNHVAKLRASLDEIGAVLDRAALAI